MRRAIAGRANSSTWSPACGTAGRTTPSFATSRSGVYFDPEKLHVLDHKGEHLSVRGPLNIARPIQGWPVIVQAGASEAGRQIAAETAEVVFAGGEQSRRRRSVFYADVKGRMEKLGRVAGPSEDPARALCRGWRNAGRGARKEGAARQPGPSRQRPRVALGARSATMRRASTSTVRCRRFPKAMPARAAARRVVEHGPAGEDDRPPARSICRRLRRPRR